MLFKKEYSDGFRSAINSTNIFYKDENLRKNFNLYCAIMDRVDSSIDYLNSNSTTPKTENQLLLFMVHCCIIYDAIIQLREVLEFEYPFEDGSQDPFMYFKNICLSSPLNIPEDKIPTDDKFFEYLRSMMMAHPFKTSRPKFFDTKEIQYSPLLIADPILASIRGHDNEIGFRVYSNQRDDLKDIIFSFDLLKEYINSRYELFTLATEKINGLIQNAKSEWKKDKVDVSLSHLETLKDIRRIVKVRFLETDYVDLTIEYLTFHNDQSSPNYEIVEKFQSTIQSAIPDLISSLEAINHEEFYNILLSILDASPKIEHKMAGYQLEKIFGYLNNDASYNNFDYGLKMCTSFYNSFANKWVYIDFDNMDQNEIKMLIRISLYYEFLEQSK